MKKPVTEAQENITRKLEDSLLALKIFGGITTVQIPIEIPEDKSLIGGMVIRIGDRVVDSSISTKLDELEKQLMKIQLG